MLTEMNGQSLGTAHIYMCTHIVNEIEAIEVRFLGSIEL